MNILILAAGSTGTEVGEGGYPLCLAEQDGVPLIERIIRACDRVGDARYIVALREEEIRRYHLDNVVALLAPGTRILRITEDTRGAACTALRAVGWIDTDEELLILNGNELLDEDYSKILSAFRLRQLDAGTVVFPSVHPRYSYVRLNPEGYVIEAAEKNPISRNATAGFYWFSSGRRFVCAAQNMIRKDASVNDIFYICPILNELVLEQAQIGVHPVEARQYLPLKNERQLFQYEISADQKKANEARKT